MQISTTEFVITEHTLNHFFCVYLMYRDDDHLFYIWPLSMSKLFFFCICFISSYLKGSVQYMTLEPN